MGNAVTAQELLLRGGHWLGALRNRIKWMRCGPLANGERVTWGSNERIEPPLSISEVEELGAEAAAAALGDAQVEIDRLHAEVERLTGWLEKIEGGDRPCQDESQLRQWAYAAVTLGHTP